MLSSWFNYTICIFSPPKRVLQPTSQIPKFFFRVGGGGVGRSECTHTCFVQAQVRLVQRQQQRLLCSVRRPRREHRYLALLSRRLEVCSAQRKLRPHRLSDRRRLEGYSDRSRQRYVFCENNGFWFLVLDTMPGHRFEFIVAKSRYVWLWQFEIQTTWREVYRGTRSFRANYWNGIPFYLPICGSTLCDSLVASLSASAFLFPISLLPDTLTSSLIFSLFSEQVNPIQFSLLYSLYLFCYLCYIRSKNLWCTCCSWAGFLLSLTI